MILHFGSFQMDLDRFEVRHSDEELDLPPKVFGVLRALVENPDRTVTKQELLDGIWPDVAVTEAVLTQAVHTARRILGPSLEMPRSSRPSGDAAIGSVFR